MLFNLYSNGFHLNSFSPHMVRRHGDCVILAGVIGYIPIFRCCSSPAGAFKSVLVLFGKQPLMQPEMMRKNIPSEDQPHSFVIHTYEFRSCVVSKRTPARITLYHAKVCCGHSDFPMLLISCKCVQECFGSFWEVATDAAGDDAEKHTFGRSTTQLRNSYI